MKMKLHFVANQIATADLIKLSDPPGTFYLRSLDSHDYF